MAQPFIGQIAMFAGNFPPLGYALCNGQLMAIAQNTALFSLLGTTYGGDGVSTFALPDLRGRVPIHQGNASTGTQYVIGEIIGTESVQLISSQMPAHTHSAAVGNGTTDSPVGSIPASDPGGNVAQFKIGAANAAMSPTAIGVSGSNTPHSNVQPCLTVNFIIALFGVFPSRN
jgi:microcystin-dependent protein